MKNLNRRMRNVQEAPSLIFSEHARNSRSGSVFSRIELWRDSEKREREREEGRRRELPDTMGLVRLSRLKVG